MQNIDPISESSLIIGNCILIREQVANRSVHLYTSACRSAIMDYSVHCNEIIGLLGATGVMYAACGLALIKPVDQITSKAYIQSWIHGTFINFF